MQNKDKLSINKDLPKVPFRIKKMEDNKFENTNYNPQVQNNEEDQSSPSIFVNNLDFEKQFYLDKVETANQFREVIDNILNELLYIPLDSDSEIDETINPDPLKEDPNIQNVDINKVFEDTLEENKINRKFDTNALQLLGLYSHKELIIHLLKDFVIYNNVIKDQTLKLEYLNKLPEEVRIKDPLFLTIKKHNIKFTNTNYSKLMHKIQVYRLLDIVYYDFNKVIDKTDYENMVKVIFDFKTQSLREYLKGLRGIKQIKLTPESLAKELSKLESHLKDQTPNKFHIIIPHLLLIFIFKLIIIEQESVNIIETKSFNYIQRKRLKKYKELNKTYSEQVPFNHYYEVVYKPGSQKTLIHQLVLNQTQLLKKKLLLRNESIIDSETIDIIQNSINQTFYDLILLNYLYNDEHQYNIDINNILLKIPDIFTLEIFNIDLYKEKVYKEEILKQVRKLMYEKLNLLYKDHIFFINQDDNVRKQNFAKLINSVPAYQLEPYGPVEKLVLNKTNKPKMQDNKWWEEIGLIYAYGTNNPLLMYISFEQIRARPLENLPLKDLSNYLLINQFNDIHGALHIFNYLSDKISRNKEQNVSLNETFEDDLISHYQDNNNINNIYNNYHNKYEDSLIPINKDKNKHCLIIGKNNLQTPLVINKLVSLINNNNAKITIESISADSNIKNLDITSIEENLKDYLIDTTLNNKNKSNHNLRTIEDIRLDNENSEYIPNLKLNYYDYLLYYKLLNLVNISSLSVDYININKDNLDKLYNHQLNKINNIESKYYEKDQEDEEILTNPIDIQNKNRLLLEINIDFNKINYTTIQLKELIYFQLYTQIFNILNSKDPLFIIKIEKENENYKKTFKAEYLLKEIDEINKNILTYKDLSPEHIINNLEQKMPLNTDIIEIPPYYLTKKRYKPINYLSTKYNKDLDTELRKKTSIAYLYELYDHNTKLQYRIKDIIIYFKDHKDFLRKVESINNYVSLMKFYVNKSDPKNIIESILYYRIQYLDHPTIIYKTKESKINQNLNYDIFIINSQEMYKLQDYINNNYKYDILFIKDQNIQYIPLICKYKSSFYKFNLTISNNKLLELKIQGNKSSKPIILRDYLQYHNNNLILFNQAIDLTQNSNIFNKSNLETYNQLQMKNYNIDQTYNINDLISSLLNKDIEIDNKCSLIDLWKEVDFGEANQIFTHKGIKAYEYELKDLESNIQNQDYPTGKPRYIYGSDQTLDHIFGLVYIKVIIPDSLKSSLPARLKYNKNIIIYPTGEIEGWYFSEEIKVIAAKGIKVEILYGITYERTKLFKNSNDKILKDYINNDKHYMILNGKRILINYPDLSNYSDKIANNNILDNPIIKVVINSYRRIIQNSEVDRLRTYGNVIAILNNKILQSKTIKSRSESKLELKRIIHEVQIKNNKYYKYSIQNSDKLNKLKSFNHLLINKITSPSNSTYNKILNRYKEEYYSEGILYNISENIIKENNSNLENNNNNKINKYNTERIERVGKNFLYGEYITQKDKLISRNQIKLKDLNINKFDLIKENEISSERFKESSKYLLKDNLKEDNITFIKSLSYDPIRNKIKINNKSIIKEINNNIIKRIEYTLNNQLFISQSPKVKLTNNQYKSYEYDHLIYKGIEKDNYTLVVNNNKSNELISYYKFLINNKSKESINKLYKLIGLRLNNPIRLKDYISILKGSSNEEGI